MNRSSNLRILFAGYAPVHFLCFRPLFECLSRLPGVEVAVSGGLRNKTGSGYRFDTAAMYQGFDLPPAQVLRVEDIATRDFDVLFAAHTSLILPRRVVKRIQIFHGISYRNKAIRPENMGCDHYFIVGPYMHRRFVEAGLFTGLDDDRAVPVGFMKTDRLLDGTLDRAQILAQLGFTGERPILLYAPTGAHMNSLEVMGEAVIERLLARGRYDLLVKLHDHPKDQEVDWFARLVRYQGMHCRIARSIDIIPWMAASDLLISDASSVANEYTLLNRPMVFLDVPELLQQAREAQDSMLDLETWGRKGGMVADGPEETESAIAASLEQPAARSAIRQAIARDLFYNPGTATETAMTWLRRHVLGDTKEYPATASVNTSPSTKRSAV